VVREVKACEPLVMWISSSSGVATQACDPLGGHSLTRES